MIVCGIDEAGRGPVIGPMVIACAVFDSDGRERLKEMNVRDSKKIAPSRRENLEPKIKRVALEWNLIHVHPAEIDLRRQSISLNMIEAMKMAELIRGLDTRPHKFIVDAADAVADNFRLKILEHLGQFDREIVSEHKADDRYLEVGAASVLAKVERDRKIKELKKEHGDFGSGYPSDEVTKVFIRQLMITRSLPDYVRKSWATVDFKKNQSLIDFCVPLERVLSNADEKQSKLGDFG
ncbi:MAG: ribonuclease HII [Candidatus Altiarchaeales archaeon IMC4]|nr:MAG: ribonuclease HII [Candidatus Altiarchaeales archaeon IMC4]